MVRITHIWQPGANGQTLPDQIWGLEIIVIQRHRAVGHIRRFVQYAQVVVIEQLIISKLALSILIMPVKPKI